MILNRLLYSRSFSKDYRWILVPAEQSPEDQDGITELLRQLNDEYDLYDRSKGLTPDGEGTLLFGKSVGAYGVLCRCGPTRHEDALGRRIFALNGLLARQEEKKEFAAALPYLVALGDECLDVSVELGAPETDQIKNEIATESVVLDELRAKLPATAQEWLRMPHMQWKKPQGLRSGDDGLHYLLRVLGSPLIPWIDFAFAAPAQLARRMGTFDVVAGDIGLSVGAVGTLPSGPVKARGHAGGSSSVQSAGSEAKTAPRRKEKADSRRVRSAKDSARSKSGIRLGNDSPPRTTGRSGRPRRPVTPILPDDFDKEPSADDDEALRIRGVTDSSYIDKVLDRVYFRFEAYETGGYVAGQSERFLLSRNLKRDHVAQKNALDGLLEELGGRGYERPDDGKNDWSEFVLRRVRQRNQQKGAL
jgi:hypothetical protein